jgi:hypothetical protein
MNELLAKILDAHSGLERWNRYNKVEATIVSGEASSRRKASSRIPIRAA